MKVTSEFGKEMELTFPEDREDIYQMRLCREGSLQLDLFMFITAPEDVAEAKAELEKVKAECRDEADYEAWKEAYLAKAYEEYRETRFVTIEFTANGKGLYRLCCPDFKEEELRDVILETLPEADWVETTSVVGSRDATEAEVKAMLAAMVDPDYDF